MILNCHLQAPSTVRRMRISSPPVPGTFPKCLSVADVGPELLLFKNGAVMTARSLATPQKTYFTHNVSAILYLEPNVYYHCVTRVTTSGRK